jgi:two-component system sensor kinase FixL
MSTFQGDPAVRLRAILDTTVDAILVIDDVGTVESFNPAAERIFGYLARDVLGKNVRMLMPDRFSSEHDTYLSNYRTTGQKKIIGIGREVECLRADGSIFPADLSVAEMVIDGQRFYTGFLRDITERKAAEAEVIQNSAKLRSILNTTVDAIIVIDENGRIESFNPAAEHLFGYTAEEATGQNVNSTQHDRYLRNYL